MKQVGWKGEKIRHDLAARGITNSRSFGEELPSVAPIALPPSSPSTMPIPSNTLTPEQQMLVSTTQQIQAQQTEEDRDKPLRERAINAQIAAGDATWGTAKAIPGYGPLIAASENVPMTTGWMLKRQKVVAEKRKDTGAVRGQGGIVSAVGEGRYGLTERGQYPDGTLYFRIYKGPKSNEIRKEFHAQRLSDLERQVEQYTGKEI